MLGVAWVIIGFALRLNPMLIVVSAGLLTGMLAGHQLIAVLEMIGEAFIKQRYLALVLLTLPVIGMLERHGLRQHAQRWISSLKGATLSRLLISYLGARQLLATMGLTSIGGHPQTVRPLLAPMAEGAADSKIGPISEADRQRLLGLCAATDNVGLFFGEDVFIAFGAVLLMQGFYAEQGIELEPLQIALWGIPTAICAFSIHAIRIQRFETQLRRATERLVAEGAPP
nr:DUF969 domain-containing protein [Pseudomarimonas arenosa]